jgi:hypothetical protein
MGVSDFTFDRGMVLATLSRSGGTKLAQYQYGPELPEHMRDFKATGTGVGHVYIHVEGGGDSIVGKGSGRWDRSVFDSAETAITAIVELLTHPTVKAALRRLDQWPQPNPQEWIKHIPVTGDYYGYPQHSDHKKKIKTCAINMRSHGDALFISSCYPDSFIT